MRVLPERYRFPLLFALFLVVTTAYLYWGGREPGRQEPPPENVPSSEEPAQFTIGADSRLIYRVTYSQCEHEEILRERLPSDEIGLTLEDLKTIYREWNVEQDGTDVIFRAVVDGLCAVCRERLFVGIHEGRVAVFYGEPGGNSWLKEVTEIPLESLPLQEQADLRVGIPVEDEAQLPALLEGFMN